MCNEKGCKVADERDLQETNVEEATKAEVVFLHLFLRKAVIIYLFKFPDWPESITSDAIAMAVKV